MLNAFLKTLQLCDYSILFNNELITTEAGKPIAKILSKVFVDALFPAQLPGSLYQCFSYQNCSDFLSKATSGFSDEIAYEQLVIASGDELNTCVPTLLHSEVFSSSVSQCAFSAEKILTFGGIMVGGALLGGAFLLWQGYRNKQTANPPQAQRQQLSFDGPKKAVNSK